VTRIICGVDVSSGTLDCRIGTDGPELRVKNNSEGIEELAEFCRHHGVELVAMEATGGYERLAFGLLWAKDLPCAVLNPRAVRQFAQAMGYLEKTDRIDAGVIAWFAQVKRIVGQPPASRTQQRLRALVSRLAQLTLLSSAQKNQRRLVSDVEVLASIDEILAAVRRQIRLFENKIAELLDSDPLWRASAWRRLRATAATQVEHDQYGAGGAPSAMCWSWSQLSSVDTIRTSSPSSRS
jgi:transposase